MRETKRFGDVSVKRRREDRAPRFLEREPGALEPEMGRRGRQTGWPRRLDALLGDPQLTERATRWPELLERASLLDELPLSRRPGDPRTRRRCIAEQRTSNGDEVRLLPHDDEHRDLERVRQAMDVDDVESSERDSLKHHALHVQTKLTRAHELDDSSRGVRAIASNASAHDPVDTRGGTDDADEEDVATMVAREGPVVEADDVHVESSISHGSWPVEGQPPNVQLVERGGRMRLLVVGVVVGLVTGCNVQMHGTSPARDGYLYAVGAKNSRPTVWLCPNAPAKGECHEVTVTEENR